MNTYDNKTQNNDGRSVANAFLQKRESNESSVQSLKNTPEALTQRKTGQIADSIPQAEDTAHHQGLPHRYSGKQPPESHTGSDNDFRTGMGGFLGASLKIDPRPNKPTQLTTHIGRGNDVSFERTPEKHSSPEAWHIIHQKQERSETSLQMKGNINLYNHQVAGKAAGTTTRHPIQSKRKPMVPPKPFQLLQPDQRQEMVTQRLVGAAAPIAGHDEILPGVVAGRGAAALRISEYINQRTRETGLGAHARSSPLGGNNPGNLYVKSDYTNGAGQQSSLETWSELTPVGGGYVKRVRITENNIVIMDRVMNDPQSTALNTALAANAALGAVGPVGNRQYGSVHNIAANDAQGLHFGGVQDQDADNITKVVGEGARFGWLARGLSDGTYGNNSRGVFKVSIKIPQEGKLTMDPTFQQLWGAWDSVFNRHFMGDKQEAVSLLRSRLMPNLRSKRDTDVAGAAPLPSGAQANGQVTSLSRISGEIALIPEGVSARIIADLGMTWNSDR